VCVIGCGKSPPGTDLNENEVSSLFSQDGFGDAKWGVTMQNMQNIFSEWCFEKFSKHSVFIEIILQTDVTLCNIPTTLRFHFVENSLSYIDILYNAPDASNLESDYTKMVALLRKNYGIPLGLKPNGDGLWNTADQESKIILKKDNEMFHIQFVGSRFLAKCIKEQMYNNNKMSYP
jgi:hypothetical protein